MSLARSWVAVLFACTGCFEVRSEHQGDVDAGTAGDAAITDDGGAIVDAGDPPADAPVVTDGGCMPRTCADADVLVDHCGTIDDGCGNQLACACDAPLVCGARAPNVCGIAEANRFSDTAARIANLLMAEPQPAGRP